MTKHKLVTFHIHSIPGPHAKVSERLYDRLEAKVEKRGQRTLSTPLLTCSLGPPVVLRPVLQVLMNRAAGASCACDNPHNTPGTPEMEPVLGGPH